MEDTSDVNVLREQNLIKMKAEVDKAFENRRKTFFVPGYGQSIDSIREGNATRDRFAELKDDEYVESPSRLMPWSAGVKNSHDFRDLLIIAYQKLHQAQGLDPDNPELLQKIKETADEILEHEFQHHVPALGQPEVNLLYGISFEQNTSKLGESISMSAFIQLSGKITKRLMLDVAQAPEKPSYTDQLHGK